MKHVKKGWIYILVLGLMLLAVGCSSKTDTGSSSSSVNQVSEGNNASERPDRVPDLEGKVKQIRGNEITALKVIRNRPEPTEEEKAKRRQQMMNLTSEERAKVQAEMMTVTDETIDLTIPVGVPIVSNVIGGGTTVTEEVPLADIKQGSIIRLWFAEGSSDEIIYVQVMRSGQ